MSRLLLLIVICVSSYVAWSMADAPAKKAIIDSFKRHAPVLTLIVFGLLALMFITINLPSLNLFNRS